MSAELLDMIAAYDVTTDKKTKKVVRQVNKSLDNAFTTMVKDLKIYYEKQEKGGSIRARLKVKRSARLAQILAKINPDKAGAYIAQLQALLKTSNAAGDTLAKELIEVTQGSSSKDFDEFGDIPFAAIVDQAKEGSKRLKKHTDTFISKATAVVEESLAQGFGARTVTNLLSKELGILKSNAEMIARTEMSSAFNTAATRRYERSGVEYVQSVVTPNRNLCPFCAGRNGVIYPIGKISIPYHPRCYCYHLPYKKEWDDDGLIDKDFFIQYHKDRVSDIRKQGREPNYTDAAPFERLAGKKRAPKHTWTPRGKKVTPPPVEKSESEPITIIKQVKSLFEAELKDIVKNSPPQIKAASQAIAEKGQKSFREYERLAVSHHQRQLQKADFLRDELIALGRLENSGYRAGLSLEDGIEFDARVTELISSRHRLIQVEIEKIIFSMMTKKSPREADSWLKRINVSPSVLESDRGAFKRAWRMADGKTKLTDVVLENERPYAMRSGRKVLINVGDDETRESRTAAIFHELGHTIEYQNPNYRNAANEWLRSRATSKTPKTINELVGINIYSDTEFALPGNFIDPYVAKIYSDGSTEVLAMGFEQMHSTRTMANFYLEDPGHFRLTLGIVEDSTSYVIPRSIQEAADNDD